METERAERKSSTVRFPDFLDFRGKLFSGWGSGEKSLRTKKGLEIRILRNQIKIKKK